MIGDWVHDFNPSFSGVFALTFVAMLIVALVSGWRSVRIRPYRREDGRRTSFYSRKKSDLRRSIGRDFDVRRERTKSTIVFCSMTVDVIWSALSAGLIGYVFFEEHWDGFVQLIINYIDRSAGAAWADLIALFCLSCFVVLYGIGFYNLRYYAQQRRAESFVREYLAQRVKPIIKENPHLKYRFEALIEFAKRKKYDWFATERDPKYEVEDQTNTF